jgi:hypothetical protein
MPSTSKKQHNFMAAVANNASFAKKAGVPQSVGKDFADADKGKKFGKGDNTRADVQSINQPKTNHGSMALFKQGGTMASKMNAGFMAMIAKKKAGAKKEMPMKKGGMAMKKMAMGGSASSRADGIAVKGKTKGKMMAKGGKAC